MCIDLFWRSCWEVIGTRLEWFCSQRFWIKRVAGLVSVVGLVFVESDGPVQVELIVIATETLGLISRSRWEVMGIR